MNRSLEQVGLDFDHARRLLQGARRLAQGLGLPSQGGAALLEEIEDRVRGCEGPRDELASPPGAGTAEPTPHSAEETKQDRLGGGQADAPKPVPVDRATLLAQLYEKLPAAKDPNAARNIMTTIEQVWRTSGTSTSGSFFKVSI